MNDTCTSTSIQLATEAMRNTDYVQKIKQGKTNQTKNKQNRPGTTT